MGLENTAHYLKSKGRNDDTELVHMTKGEVHALKGLAAAHGGEITINPETGLPEAGFLSSILPMAAGIATAVFAPELLPLVAGGIGLADYAMTGSIGKGLMAGLSAYGAGSTMGSIEALGAEGVEAAATGAGNEAVQQAATQIPEIGMKATFDASGAVNSAMNPSAWAEAAPVSNITEAGQALQTGAISPEQYQNIAQQYSGAYADAAKAASPTMMGLKAAAAAPGTFLMNNAGSIAMAASPLLMDGMGQNKTQPTGSTGPKNPMGMATMSPNYQPTRPTQPNPYYIAQYPDYKRNPYQPGVTSPTYPSVSGTYAPITAADGGLMSSGPDKTDFMGGGAFPMSQQSRSYYATPTQMPTSAQAAMSSYEPKTNPLTGEVTALAQGGIASYSGKYGSVVAMNDAINSLEDLYGMQTPKHVSHADPGIYQDTDPNTRHLDPYEAALYRIKQKSKAAGMSKDAITLPKPMLKLGDINPDDNTSSSEDLAGGGITSLGGYASGGNPRLLKGPGDGMSDSIPASIGGRQPARLADGEFVVPADVVSHLGNGSTDAGAKKLYSMMDKIRKARTGKKKQAPEVKADKYIPT